MSISPISNSFSGIQRQSAAMDRAAEKIARASAIDLNESSSTAVDTGAVASNESAMVDGKVELIVATRMFSAAIKVAQVANEGILESLRLGGYGAISA